MDDLRRKQMKGKCIPLDNLETSSQKSKRWV